MRSANEPRQLLLAMLDRSAGQVRAVELDQIEGAQHRGAAIARPADQIKHRKALVVGDDCLADRVLAAIAITLNVKLATPQGSQPSLDPPTPTHIFHCDVSR